jgi:hypothetical protein
MLRHGGPDGRRVQRRTAVLITEVEGSMKAVLRSVGAVLAGLVIGSMVNMGLIMISGSVIPPPEGADVTTAEGLRAALPLFEPRHFVFPYLAHALGTLAGAFLAALIAATRKTGLAVVVGVCFLAGGVANVIMLPSPLWFSILDLACAYIPMALVGARLAARTQAPRT